MSDEYGVVVMKLAVAAIAQSRTRDMRAGPVTNNLDHAFIPRHLAIGGQREGLEQRPRPDPGEAVRDRAAFMVASLGADMMEAAALSNVDLQHLVEPRRRGAGLEKRDLRPCLHPHAMVQDRVRTVGFVPVDQVDRFGPPCRLTRIRTPSRAAAVFSAASGRATGDWPRASSAP